MINNDIRLCYVDGPWAYFTTCPLNLQQGDRWGDVPRSDDVNLPHDNHVFNNEKIHHLVTKVAWDGPFLTPDKCHHSSNLSVEMINKGSVPWLTPKQLDEKPIYAGISLNDFIDLIESSGGNVYFQR